MDAAEVWRPIPGFPRHEASSAGRIRSLDHTRSALRRGKLVAVRIKGRVLAQHLSGRYLAVPVEGRKQYVHTLVLMAFVGPRPEGMEACHSNGKRWDNRPGNLRWDTHANNNMERLAHGTLPMGDSHPKAKYRSEQLKRLFSTQMTDRQIAEELGCSRDYVYRIRTGRKWKHLELA